MVGNPLANLIEVKAQQNAMAPITQKRARKKHGKKARTDKQKL
jgi:hypothetical protein